MTYKIRGLEMPLPNPDHLKWVIEGRAETQRTALRLYRIFRNQENALNSDFGFEARTLVSVAFSLWRAVFLAERNSEIELKNKSAKLFLSKMLETNAITFAQDFDSRDWSFVYYVQVAQLFLLRLRDNRKSPIELSTRVGTKKWDQLQRLFDEEIDWLEHQLKPKKKKKSP
jgi:hypothetical protein